MSTCFPHALNSANPRNHTGMYKASHWKREGHAKVLFSFLDFVVSKMGENSTAVSVFLMHDTQKQDREREHRS